MCIQYVFVYPESKDCNNLATLAQEWKSRELHVVVFALEVTYLYPKGPSFSNGNFLSVTL